MCGWSLYMLYSTEPCQMLLEVVEALSVSFQVNCKTVGSFSQNPFCRARSGDALFWRKAREEFFAVVVVFFASLWNLTLRFYPHSRPSLWRARARWFLTKAKIRAVLQSTYQEKRFLSPERRSFSFERYFKHLLRFSQFSDPTDVGAFTTKLPTTNQSELQVTFGLLYVWKWTYLWY